MAAPDTRIGRVHFFGNSPSVGISTTCFWASARTDRVMARPEEDAVEVPLISRSSRWVWCLARESSLFTFEK
ncbi:MAG: hypothetical protein R2818_06585 [Flavobacteriales bacterium]